MTVDRFTTLLVAGTGPVVHVPISFGGVLAQL
jgi:hypothetical protein